MSCGVRVFKGSSDFYSVLVSHLQIFNISIYVDFGWNRLKTVMDNT